MQFYGALNTINPMTVYRITTNNVNYIEYSGNKIGLPYNFTIDKGFTWFCTPYLVDISINLLLNSDFIDFSFNDGDEIVDLNNQTIKSIYNLSSNTFDGSLNNLKAKLGYMINCSGGIMTFKQHPIEPEIDYFSLILNSYTTYDGETIIKHYHNNTYNGIWLSIIKNDYEEKFVYFSESPNNNSNAKNTYLKENVLFSMNNNDETITVNI